MERLPSVPDDGLFTPDVGEWNETKYQVIRCYATIFTTAMSRTWSALTYIDLFAAAGRALLRDSRRIVFSSPSIVLDIPKPFSRYIFCEINPKMSAVLAARSQRADRDVHVIHGDCNANMNHISELVPSGSLVFCFADPYKIENLKFESVRRLATGNRVDFLILLPSGMDINRNAATYAKESDTRVEDFVGSPDWRERWTSTGSRLNFGDFVADEFGRSMKGMGYRYQGLSGTKTIVNEKNVPLYRLAFFSKHALGSKFWDECKKYTDPQRALF